MVKNKVQKLRDIEKKLWIAAEKLRINMDASEYKHVVLGLIFLKYTSDSFENFRTKLVEQKKTNKKKLEALLEDQKYYISNNIFWVPPKARWHKTYKNSGIQNKANDPNIGKIIDSAMEQIEKDNPKLKNVLPKGFAKRQTNIRLGELIELISTIGFNNLEYNAKDILGHVYEYFLGQFASLEGRKGGQFYTPKSVVNLIVECLEPYKGKVYDPAMGSGGFFVSSEKFIEAHINGNNVNQARRKISLYGQESNPTTWKLSAMNMAIRGFEFNFGKKPADTFIDNQHKNLKANFVMANPPFNVSDWGGDKLTKDKRWKYGMPPKNNANFAWIQHIIHHLSPQGFAGVVLANGSMSSNTNNEGAIRTKLICADLVDCMIALPGQLFSNTQIPACIWILAKDKSGKDKKRQRKNELLFLDARNLGIMISRVQKIFENDDIKKIATTYHNWRNTDGNYKDIVGFCKSSTLEEIKSNDYVLNPGRYVGIARSEEKGLPYQKKMDELVQQLKVDFNKSDKLKKQIQKNLSDLGFSI